MAIQVTSGQKVMELLAQAGSNDLKGELGGTCISDDDFGLEIGSLVSQCLASSSATVNAGCIERVVELSRAKWMAMHAFYAAYVVGITAHRNMKPNASATLYGPTADLDAVYAGNTAYPLTPRSSNGVETAFTFDEEMMFFQAATERVDIDVGWRVVGGTMKFKNDPVSGALKDTSFSVYDEQGDGLDSPLQTYRYRRPNATVDFTCSAMHNNAAPTQLKCGFTLLMLDMRCRNAVKGFQDSLFELEFGQAVGAIMRQHRGLCMQGGPLGGDTRVKLLG